MQRILIVDTDEDRRGRLTFLLRHMGYAVDVHPRGPENSDMVLEPGLMLVSEEFLNDAIDGESPWMPNTLETPKVVLGTETEEVAGVPYLEMGADVYLPAPLNTRVLLAVVRAVLNRREGFAGRSRDVWWSATPDVAGGVDRRPLAEEAM